MDVNKGVVIEVDDKKAIVMTKDGDFESISLRQYPGIKLGEEVVLKEKKSIFVLPKPMIYAVSMAVICLFVIANIFNPGNQMAVAAYISIDINPSIEVGVNEQNEVVQVNPLNEDAKKLLSKMSGDKGMELEQFLRNVLVTSKESGYFEYNHDVLMATTMVNPGAKEKVTNSISDAVEGFVSGKKGEVQLTTLSVDDDKRKKAKEAGLSSGKYMIYLKYADQNEKAITIKEVQESSVTTIRQKMMGSSVQKTDEKKRNADGGNKNKQKNDKERKKAGNQRKGIEKATADNRIQGNKEGVVEGNTKEAKQERAQPENAEKVKSEGLVKGDKKEAEDKGQEVKAEKAAEGKVFKPNASNRSEKKEEKVEVPSVQKGQNEKRSFQREK